MSQIIFDQLLLQSFTVKFTYEASILVVTSNFNILVLRFVVMLREILMLVLKWQII